MAILNAPSGLVLSLAANGFTPSIGIPMKTQFYTGQGGISLLLNFTSGASLTAGVQISNDPLSNPNNTIAQQNSARWNPHSVLTNLTASQSSSIVFPVYALRLAVTNWSSGTAYLDIGVLDYQL